MLGWDILGVRHLPQDEIARRSSRVRTGPAETTWDKSMLGWDTGSAPYGPNPPNAVD